MRRLDVMFLILFALSACSVGQTAPTPTPSSMSMSTPGEHMVHEAQHGGQLGMGKTIHIRTESIKLKNRKLYIKVNSSVLKEELHYSRGKVLEIINKEFEKPVADEVVIL